MTIESPDSTKPTTVSVVNFDMPFWSIVVLMLKVAVAAIPAAFIVALLTGIFSGLLVGLGI